MQSFTRIISGFILASYLFLSPGFAQAAHPWQENQNGILKVNVKQKGTVKLGYVFVPVQNGHITALGGFFNGTKTVQLINAQTGQILVSASVSSNNQWKFMPINPVVVQAGTTYKVVAEFGNGQASVRSRIKPFPQTYSGIKILNSFKHQGTKVSNVTDKMLGQLDVEFTVVSRCGNNVVDSGEACDGNSQNCTVNGYAGTQRCNTACSGFNPCATTQRCGDGIVNGNEICDGNTVNCTTSSGYTGTQGCANTCLGFNLCVSSQYCGDGSVNGNEVCDEGSLNGQPNHCNASCSGIHTCAGSVYYQDLDGDRYGNPAVSITNDDCVPPAGYVTDNTDCDDTQMFVFPNADENCDDGLDNNCPGESGFGLEDCKDTVCSANEKCVVRNDGLVGFWKFEDADRATARDDSGFSNDGSLRNDIKRISGFRGQGLFLDGKDDYVEIPSSAQLNVTSGDFTLAAWIQIPHQELPQTIISINGYELAISVNAVGCEIGQLCFGSPGNWQGVPLTLIPGTWSHVVFVKENSVGKFYINGAAVGNISVTVNQSMNVPLIIGNSFDDTRPFWGMIDEVEVYRRVINVTETSTLASDNRQEVELSLVCVTDSDDTLANPEASYLVQGQVTMENGLSSYSDFCNPEDSQHKEMVELGCDSGNLTLTGVVCPNGCSSGRCL